MTSQSSFTGGAAAQRPTVPIIVVLTAKEAAKLLKVSLSWLAKARMRGDGPPTSRSAGPYATAKPPCSSG